MPATSTLPSSDAVTDVGCTFVAVLEVVRRERLACIVGDKRCLSGSGTQAKAVEAHCRKAALGTGSRVDSGLEAGCCRRLEGVARHQRRQPAHRCAGPPGLAVDVRLRQQPCGRPLPASCEPSIPSGSP